MFAVGPRANRTSEIQCKGRRASLLRIWGVGVWWGQARPELDGHLTHQHTLKPNNFIASQLSLNERQPTKSMTISRAVLLICLMVCRNEKRARGRVFTEGLAEAVRFELTDPFESPVFKTGAIDHSATLPWGLIVSI